jgi:hypothetical protein
LDSEQKVLSGETVEDEEEEKPTVVDRHEGVLMKI